MLAEAPVKEYTVSLRQRPALSSKDTDTALLARMCTGCGLRWQEKPGNVPAAPGILAAHEQKMDHLGR
jgi:hypothetical protein